MPLLITSPSVSEFSSLSLLVYDLDWFEGFGPGVLWMPLSRGLSDAFLTLRPGDGGLGGRAQGPSAFPTTRSLSPQAEVTWIAWSRCCLLTFFSYFPPFALLCVGRRGEGFMGPPPGRGHIYFHCLGFFCDESLSSSLINYFCRKRTSYIPLTTHLSPGGLTACLVT